MGSLTGLQNLVLQNMILKGPLPSGVLSASGLTSLVLEGMYGLTGTISSAIR